MANSTSAGYDQVFEGVQNASGVALEAPRADGQGRVPITIADIRGCGAKHSSKENNSALKSIRDTCEDPPGEPCCWGVDLRGHEVFPVYTVQHHDKSELYDLVEPTNPWSWRAMLNIMEDATLGITCQPIPRQTDFKRLAAWHKHKVHITDEVSVPTWDFVVTRTDSSGVRFHPSFKSRRIEMCDWVFEGGLADVSASPGLQHSTVVAAASGDDPAPIHGGGFPKDELVVMTCHMHAMTAKKEITDGAMSLKKLWGEMARYIVEFGVRLLTGDFNMALWPTVVELRARGVQANLAAWYPWKNGLEAAVRIDSCAIIVIGLAVGGEKDVRPFSAG